MIKAICPKCNSLILIDEKNNVTKCPNCNEEIFTMSAFKLYNRTVSLYKRKGEIALNASTNYLEAYKNYELLIKLAEDNLNVLINLVTSRLYCSNLKHIYIKEATDLLIKGSDKIEIGTDNINTLNDFLIKVRKDSRKIVDALKGIANQSNFSKNNYLNSLGEYKYYLEAYKNIFDSLTTLNNYFTESPDIITDEIKYCVDELKKPIKVINESNNEIDYLDKKGKVNNDIFPNHKKLYRFRIVLYITTGVGFILSIVGLSLLNAGIPAAAKFSILGVGLLFFIGGYFLGHHLKSKQYNLKY